MAMVILLRGAAASLPLLLLLLIASSSPSPCTGFSSRGGGGGGKPRRQRPRPRREGGVDVDVPSRVVADAIVRDVAPKVARKPKGSPTGSTSKRNDATRRRAPNARQRSIAQRDPIISLNMNLDYLAKSGQRDAARRCAEMLFRIEALHDDGYYERAPDVVSYNSVVNAYARGRSPGKGGESRSGHARRLMRRMEERGIKPNAVTWNVLLRCIAREVSEKPGGGLAAEKCKEAESVLGDMEASGLANAISYNTVASILSKSRLEDAAERAESWLRRMMERYEATNDDRIQPDTCSFNSVIHAYANAGGSSAGGAPGRARRAEALLEQMERLRMSGENDAVAPDVVTYSALISAYARAASEDERYATRAMEVLEWMERGGKVDVRPNQRTYASVIHAFARVGKAEVADDILSRMKDRHASGDEASKPDAVCYSSVLEAYAKKGGEDAAYRAESLLREMEERYDDGDANVKPNARTYRAVIDALGKSDRPRAAEKAEKILEEMIDLSSRGARDLRPNTIIYNSVIDAYARSKSVHKAYRAELLLERMIEASESGIDASIRPDAVTFNAVINAAARSTFGSPTDRREAYLIGLNAFKMLHERERCGPSPITYVSFLKLLRNLVEPGDARDRMAERTYGLSRSLGLANDAVKAQLRRTCSPLVAQQILAGSNAAADAERGEGT